ncbi:site-specific tyrosine recombinase XerD [Variovorax sp. SRS16]|uniref:site-specific integrase n=1 Tax=Variovorax sp. SRS16 TaxID=282217 RepID=UPI00131694AE|nr:site-specific integrase [Variovorax sp. SRS16]VTU28653.1 site-specific tyrosine recombinase XerD [Variovorax sp. SRS16]
MKIEARSAKAYAEAARAPQTKLCYASDLRHFKANGGRIPATPLQVARYLATFAGSLSVSTLQRRLWAIQEAHRSRELPNPVATSKVQDTMRGIRRTMGAAPMHAIALTRRHILQLAALHRDSGLPALRNRAMLLLGFAGAFRRSELMGLTVADISVLPDGLRIRVKRSKTDQEGHGRTVWISKAKTRASCAVESLRRWLVAAQITQGPLFRKITLGGRIGNEALSPQTLNVIVKAAARRVWGIDAANGVSGHSLRAGYCTEAASQGVPLHMIRRQTGHTSIEALMRYIRTSDSSRGTSVL